MDLILWRHAEAEDTAAGGGGDLARALTAHGVQQARRMAGWLGPRLPPDVRILCSPARRTQQTAAALARPFELHDGLAPDAGAARLLELAQWPALAAVLVVGHQPVLGRTVAQLLGLRGGECTVRKGGIWWLRSRPRQDDRPVVVAVLTPDLAAPP